MPSSTYQHYRIERCRWSVGSAGYEQVGVDTLIVSILGINTFHKILSENDNVKKQHSFRNGKH